METKYKLTAIGLDGTVLNYNGEMSGTAMAVLEKAHEKGYIIKVLTTKQDGSFIHVV